MKLLTRTISLTKAQIDALNSTPITVLTAPGAGKIVTLISAYAYKTAGNAASAGTGDIVFRYIGDADTDGVFQFSSADAATGFLGSNTNYRVQNGVASAVATGELDCRNVGIEIIASAAMTAAASTTAKIVLNFQIINA